MIYVSSSNRELVEPINNIGSDFSLEQSTDGNFKVNLTTYKTENKDENPGYELLKSKAILTVEDNEFVIEQISENEFSKSVVGLSIFYQNSKKRVNTLFDGIHSLNNHLAFTFNNSGWTYLIEDGLGSIVNYIDSLGQDNIVSMTQKISAAHGLEFIILPNKFIRFSKKLGSDNDYQYRYKYNVSDVVLNEDSSNLETFITGEGAEGIRASYTSPNVATFGILEASPIKEEGLTNQNELNDYLKRKINDTPEITISSNSIDLTQRELGETVWLIYDPLNIEMETRILSQVKKIRNGELYTDSVVLGNSLLKNSVDILVNQKQNIEENKLEAERELEESKVEYRSRFDVTDRNIVLQVERLDQSIATIDIKADNINLSVNNRITNEVAAIDIRANMIDLRVSDLDNRATSSINLLNDNINLKVDKGGSITDINLSPGNATINADRINLNGAVVVNGTITGATLIQVSTDIDLGRRIRFNDFTAISSAGGVIDIEAINGVIYTGATHTFNGIVDFSNATVIGLP